MIVNFKKNNPEIMNMTPKYCKGSLNFSFKNIIAAILSIKAEIPFQATLTVNNVEPCKHLIK